jgi:DNA-binding XRE family transcriptional regulator
LEREVTVFEAIQGGGKIMQATCPAIENELTLPQALTENPWLQADEEDVGLLLIPIGGSYSNHSVHWGTDRKPVINFGESKRHLGDLFAPGSSAISDIFVNSTRRESALPQQIELVRELRQLSGLTWHGIAEMIGVSPKTLHNWAAGKSIDGRNHKRVGEVIAVLRFIDRGSAEANRALLLNESVEGHALIDLVKAGDFARVRHASGRGKGRPVTAQRLPRSTVTAWGPEDFGESLSRWQGESFAAFELTARPTRARPASARRKG